MTAYPSPTFCVTTEPVGSLLYFFNPAVQFWSSFSGHEEDVPSSTSPIGTQSKAHFWSVTFRRAASLGSHRPNASEQDPQHH
jgi:hypothetical protein